MYQRVNGNGRVSQLEREMNKLFQGVFAPATPAASGVRMDIGETADAYRVEIDLPGVAMKDVELSLLEKTLKIKVQPEPREAGTEVTWHRRERPRVTIEESLRFPLEIDAEKVEARMQDGVLRVAIPKAAAVQPRSIPILAD